MRGRSHVGGAEPLGRTTHVDPPARLSARERSVPAEMAQGHTNAIFDKLELAGGGEGCSRRVLAVPRYLAS